METSQTGEISQMSQGLFFINYRHVIEIIQRHCSYLRKCVLTLIITSFDKMISDPIRFKEYMELKNQMLRYSVFFILTLFIFLPGYMINAIPLVTFRIHYLHWVYSVWFRCHGQLIYHISSSVVFHTAILIICLRCMMSMRQRNKEMRQNSDSSKTNILSVIFASTTFVILIIISFIIEFLSLVLASNSRAYIFGVESLQLEVDYSDVLDWIFLFYEGINGLVAMASLFLWFPSIRPVWAALKRRES